MVQACSEWVKRFARALLVVVQTDKEAAAGMQQQGARDARLAGRDAEHLDELEAEHAHIPGGAHSHIAHGEAGMEDTLKTWHGISRARRDLAHSTATSRRPAPARA